MTTGCELQEVEREHGRSFNAGDVAESADELFAIFVWVIDDQWAASLAVASTSKLSLPGTKFARSVDLVNVWACTDCFK